MALLVIAAMLGLTTPAGASTGLSRTLQRDADAILSVGAPGVLVEVDTPRGEVKVRSGYGNVAAKTPVPWDAKFRIGSYTKTFVATVVLQLVGEGRMSLDDSVERWLPGVVAGNGHDGNRITVRQLLQHTSGLPDYVGRMPHLFLEKDFRQRRFEDLTPAQAVALALALPPKPQTWDYSNTNYMLAGLVIEAVTRHDWRDEVRDRILRPLDLRDTYTPRTSPFVPRPHAVAYERFPEKGLEADPEDPRYGRAIDVTLLNPSWGGAAGEMISTTEDGNRFLRALMSGRVLRPAQLAEMKKTVPATRFHPALPGARYGLGIMWTPTSCGGSWSHGGDIHGFKTRNGVTEDGRRSIMVSINTDSLVLPDGSTAPPLDVSLPLVEHALCPR
jgi:D-alanyl-D-alanine carboxypeptidase